MKAIFDFWLRIKRSVLDYLMLLLIIYLKLTNFDFLIYIMRERLNINVKGSTAMIYGLITSKRLHVDCFTIPREKLFVRDVRFQVFKLSHQLLTSFQVNEWDWSLSFLNLNFCNNMLPKHRFRNKFLLIIFFTFTILNHRQR